MPTRRKFFLLLLVAAVAAALPQHAAIAQSSPAAAFIQSTANKLLNGMKSNGSQSSRLALLQQIVDQDVDVEGIGRFCLGRFWRLATPAQQQQYLMLFHRILLNGITGQLGNYQDVALRVGRSVPAGEDIAVASTVTATNKAPVDVQWVVARDGGAFKVVDVIAAGTSLRQTQRSEYTSYIDGHGGNVQTLIDALQQRAAQGR